MAETSATVREDNGPERPMRVLNVEPPPDHEAWKASRDYGARSMRAILAKRRIHDSPTTGTVSLEDARRAAEKVKAMRPDDPDLPPAA